MGKINFTSSELNKVIDGRFHSPIQDVVDDAFTLGSEQSISANTEYTFASNGNVRNKKVLPAHISNMWNTSTNIATFEDFLNTPEIVANVQFKFDPSDSSEGLVTVRVYVNETTPLLIKTNTIDYKGASDEPLTALLTFYAGEEVGFDVKNKGVFFTYEFSSNGNLWDRAIEIYRT